MSLAEIARENRELRMKLSEALSRIAELEGSKGQREGNAAAGSKAAPPAEKKVDHGKQHG